MKKIFKLIFISCLVLLSALLLQLINLSNASAVINCGGGNCWYVSCNVNSDCGTNQYTGATTCQGQNVWQSYMTYTCNNPGTADSYCATTVTPRHQATCSNNQSCKAGICFGENQGTSNYSPNPPPYNSNYPYCIPNSHRKCAGSSVYWFDSCNNQQSLYQNCYQGQTCSNGICENNQLNYNPRSVKGCVNNTVYWYDSLGNQKDVYQNCGATGQTCQNGQCAGQTYTQTETLQTPYAKHYITKCYDDKIHWYDSKGAVQGMYKDCKDDNQCTIDSCKDGQCVNELKCDGSACADNLPDYTKYCQEVKTTAAVSESFAMSEFLKRWYIWIVFALALVFLFIVIFRRLSSKD